MRLLGIYDNVFLSTANRDHVVPVEVRARWSGTNGGVGHTIFVDGFMAGLWWVRDGRVVTDVFTKLSKATAHGSWTRRSSGSGSSSRGEGRPSFTGA